MEGGPQDVVDYEALPDSLPASTHMIAGATAGITEHCIMYPIDCVKTRMQALNPKTSAYYSSVTQAMKSITIKEGYGRAWHGMPAVMAGAGPAHAMYFACYEKIKSVLSEKKQTTAVASMAAGGCATLFHDTLMVPADVVKQRMQMYNSPYKSSLDCARQIVRHEGVRALYRSYTTQIAMNIPFHAVHVSIYEQVQNLLNHDREYKPISHIISGGMAGSVAALATNPFDVCKTLLNTQEICCHSGKPADRGLVQAIQTVISCRGWSGFFRGAQARMLFQMPAAAVSWSVYEFFKYFISGDKYVSRDSFQGEDGETLSSSSLARKASIIAPVYANDATSR
ncbi:mitoferrin-2-like [Watersipora subatra]|uniref:mitoferrin-2-like n=1 Tax=Watersipora subatra TaxID=2589382 RepID=UPI00355C4C9E